MYLYSNYCYETLGNLSDAIYSQGEWGGNIIDAVSLSSGDDGLDIVVFVGEGTASYTYIAPSCSTVGHYPLADVLSLDDAVLLGWEGAAVLLIAYFYRLVSRTVW